STASSSTSEWRRARILCSHQRITAPERLRTLSRSDLRIELSSWREQAGGAGFRPPGPTSCAAREEWRSLVAAEPRERRRLRSPCGCPPSSRGREPGEAAHHRVSRDHLIEETAD